MWSLLFTGNWFAFFILLILLGMSALSWAVIVTKWRQLNRVQLETSHFYSAYLRDQPLSNVFGLAQKFTFSPLAVMFEVSYREITTFRRRMESGGGAAPDARDRLMANLGRTLERVYNQQHLVLERRLPWLAVVSSAAPYIGLFGTVLGIIDAFGKIGLTGMTSLAVVAPGISEALVATAAGLVAAIPALIAYNVFRNRIREMNGQMKNFALDITNRLERIL